ncbi:hypothetical protein CEXT_664841 [Caerostris extrusa]|uniref:Uncharacterized protein n=1 Tax=Caerostris extrusa TaxID=172846 RepID=A0AAV4MPR8_CAEEX|nr:hypothetical protein CEXT_664841 [Caerostris extrusa]
MEECSFKIIRSIIKLLAAITVVEIPHTQPSLITKFSFGENIVWCSTTPQIEWVTVPIHIVEGEIPVYMNGLLGYHVLLRKLLTTLLYHVNLKIIYLFHTPEHVRYTVQPGFMQERKTPAPVIKEVYQIPKRRYWETIPPVQTEVYRQTPRPNRYEDKIIRPEAEVDRFTAVLRYNEDSIGFSTKKYHWTRATRKYYETKRNTIKRFVPLQKCNHYGPWIVVAGNCSLTAPIEAILRESPGCEMVNDLECRLEDTLEDYTKSERSVTCDARRGFSCMAGEAAYSGESNVIAPNNRTGADNDTAADCCCEKFEVRVQCCGYNERVTAPAPGLFRYEVKGRAQHKTMLPPRTDIVVNIPKPKFYQEHMDATEADVVRMTLTKGIYFQRRTQTTSKLLVRQPQNDMSADSIDAPRPKMIRLTVTPRYYQERLTATTSREVFGNSKAKTSQELKIRGGLGVSIKIPVIPDTSNERFRKTSLLITKYQKGAESGESIKITIIPGPRMDFCRKTSEIGTKYQETIHTAKIDQVPTRMDRFTPDRKAYHEHIEPTKAIYIHFPVQPRVFLLTTKEATTRKYVYKPVTRRERYFEMPLPITEVVKYQQPRRSYTHKKTQTTSRLHVKQPRANMPVENVI